MNNQALHVSLPILKRYGHCNFTVPQLLVGFVLLVQRVTGDTLADAERVLTSAEQQQEYRDLMQEQVLNVLDKTLYLPMIQSDSP